MEDAVRIVDESLVKISRANESMGGDIDANRFHADAPQTVGGARVASRPTPLNGKKLFEDDRHFVQLYSADDVTVGSEYRPSSLSSISTAVSHQHSTQHGSPQQYRSERTGIRPGNNSSTSPQQPSSSELASRNSAAFSPRNNPFQQDSMTAITAQLLSVQRQCRIMEDDNARLQKVVHSSNLFLQQSRRDKLTPGQRALRQALGDLDRETDALGCRVSAKDKNSPHHIRNRGIKKEDLVNNSTVELSNVKMLLASAVDKNEALEATLSEKGAQHQRQLSELESNFLHYREQQEWRIQQLQAEILQLKQSAPHTVSTAANEFPYSTNRTSPSRYLSSSTTGFAAASSPLSSRAATLQRIRLLEEELEQAKMSNATLQDQYTKLYSFVNSSR